MVLPFLGEPSDAVPRVAKPPVDFVRAEFRKAVDEAEDDAAFVLGLLAAYRALIVFEGVKQTAFLGIVLAVAFDALPFAVLGFARVIVADDAVARGASDGARLAHVPAAL